MRIRVDVDDQDARNCFGFFPALLDRRGFFPLPDPVFPPFLALNTWAKMPSMFRNWRFKSNAFSTTRVGTLSLIMGTAATSSRKLRPSFQARMAWDWTIR